MENNEPYALRTQIVVEQYKKNRGYQDSTKRLRRLSKEDKKNCMNPIIAGYIYTAAAIIPLILVDAFLLNYFLTSLLSDQSYFIAIIVYLIASGALTTYFVRKLTSEIAHNKAEIFFIEGINAAFHQIYLAKENLPSHEYEKLYDRMLTENKHLY